MFGFGRRRSRRSKKSKSCGCHTLYKSGEFHKRTKIYIKCKKHRVSRRRKSRRSRKFGYSHDQGPQVYNAHMQDGILLADNAFQWMSNPLERSLMTGSG